MFERISPALSGLDFVNEIDESDTFNVMTFSNIYTGGGVAVGDVDGDGRTDIFLGGNRVSSRLFLNRSESGQLRFEDITATAGVTTNRWISGVTMIDINQDGLQDIYLCSTGSKIAAQRANLLFVNQGPDAEGIPRFREMARAYGLADTSYTTQAAFLDYDRDGDLDVFLIVNYPELYYGGQVNVPSRIRAIGERHKTDRLLRNEGPGPAGHPVFRDVSLEAGIVREGYSLGLAVGDLNQDGWPDLYIANDFLSDDVLYINNGPAPDGSGVTFTDRLRDYLDHTSYAGMGTDINDFNNDGLLDIVELDMLPRDDQRLKSMISGINYNRYAQRERFGYSNQYTRNTLQLNNGKNAAGNYSFSEIAQLAGIYNTDWSWSVLLADYDNDGFKDLWITNGFRRDMGDLDYINYGFESNDLHPEFLEETFLKKTHHLPGIHLSNFIFRNLGDLRFADATREWGLQTPSYSNGAAFADLDDDGDLDLVVNNLSEPAFLFRNQRTQLQPDSSNFLKISLEGASPNRQGIGAKITLRHRNGIQYQEHFPTRGFLSSMDQEIHFGLGAARTVDTLTVHWPDGRVNTLTGIAVNQTIVLRQNEALMPAASVHLPAKKADPSISLPGLLYRHQETEFIDFDYQTLLPHRHSQGGPGLAIGDVDGNGFDDIYLGAGKNFPGQLYLQNPSGKFTTNDIAGDDPAHEDLGSLLFDADGDGDLDLYVVSGSVEHGYDHPLYRDRLFVNDGKGRFRKSEQALPATLRSAGSCVTAADFDQDGDLDLFVGGSTLPGRYPLASNSFLLRNDANGKDQPAFTDISNEVKGNFSGQGIVKSALWTDFNADGWTDLITVGEFMPVTIFENKQGQLEQRHPGTLAHSTGWWNSITGADFDGDGDIDYALGNLGWNARFQVSSEFPLCIYVKDFDQNGTLDPIMCHYVDGVNVPVAYRDDFLDQLTKYKSRFNTYRAYASAKVSDIFTGEELADATVVKCETFTSSYLENLGGGNFSLRPLPVQAQVAPVFGMQVQDVNNDRRPDLVLIGNFHGNETSTGRYDAAKGAVLINLGSGAFGYQPPEQHTLFVTGDARALAELAVSPDETFLLATQNRDSLLVLPEMGSFRQMERLRPMDRAAIIRFKDGSRVVKEFYYGDGYLSQSSRILKLSDDMESIEIIDYRGASRKLSGLPMLTSK